MRVKEVMCTNPQLIGPDTSIKEAARLMRDNDFGFLPVGENDRITGSLTDRDIAMRAVAEGRDPEMTKAGEIMTQKIQYCFEEDDLKDAAEHMKEQQIRRLVVLNSKKRITGILSIGDIACKDAKLVGAVENAVCQKAA